MIKKKKYRMLIDNKLEIDFTQPAISGLDRATSELPWLPFPMRHYLSALDVFRTSVVGGEEKIRQMAAGTILSIGMIILSFSGLFADKDKMDSDFKRAKENCGNYFNHIRNLAAIHFGYKFEESAEWDYDKLIEIAARLSLVTSQDLSISKLTETKKPSATINANEVTITKGAAIPEQVVDFHNTKTFTKEN